MPLGQCCGGAFLQHSCCGYTPLALLKNTPPSSRRRAVIDAMRASQVRRKRTKKQLTRRERREKEEGTLYKIYNHISRWWPSFPGGATAKITAATLLLTGRIVCQHYNLPPPPPLFCLREMNFSFFPFFFPYPSSSSSNCTRFPLVPAFLSPWLGDAE